MKFLYTKFRKVPEENMKEEINKYKLVFKNQ